MRVLALACLVACAPPDAEPTSDPPTVPARAALVESTILDRHDFGRRSFRFDLPGRLDEISGLAFSADGRLFGHDDERARIHEIDLGARAVGKRFDLGQDEVRGDFEAVAIVGERFFLITSTGLLYEFREGADRESVAYRRTDTGVGGSCEIEGLAYDPGLEALLLACKVATPDRGRIVIHRLPLDPRRPRLAPLTVAKSELATHGLETEFDPSGIAVDPSGTLVLVSARQESIIEVDPVTGAVLAGVRLSRDRHPQPEGIAFGPDGTLYLADEQNGRDARITAYARSGPGGGP